MKREHGFGIYEMGASEGPRAGSHLVVLFSAS